MIHIFIIFDAFNFKNKITTCTLDKYNNFFWFVLLLNLYLTK